VPPVGRYNVHQLAVFDYMVEKEWMLYTYETNFKKTNGDKVFLFTAVVCCNFLFSVA
jgi:hypothetical protein